MRRGAKAIATKRVTKLNDPSLEKSHGYLERFHYQAVKDNPFYVLDGMADVLKEEILMSIPTPEEPKERTVTKTHIYMGEKSLELNRRVGDLEREQQEHYQYHSKFKKGKSYQFKTVKKEELDR